MREGYLIETTLGDSLLGPDNHVYVKASSRGYVKKRASDVNVGDMIVYKKPYTTTSLEHVEPYLPRSPRYAKARDMIHEENSQGDLIPSLRVLLLEGLADHGVIDPTNVRERAIHEEDDFSREEYRRMELYLARRLDSGGVTLSTGAIGNWLRGDTVAPRPSNWRAFRILEREVNPAFSEFQAYTDEPDSIYFNYRLYMTIRRGIMKKLNHFRGTESPGPDDQYHTDSRISLAPEFVIVAQHFITDETEVYATGRVTSKRRLIKDQIERERDRNIRLVDGIETETVEGFEGSLKGYPDVYDEYDVLERFLEAAIEDYLTLLGVFDSITNEPHKDVVFSTMVYMLPKLYRLFGEDFDPELINLERSGAELRERGHLIAQYGDEIERSLIIGEMDRALGIERGGMLSLLETAYRIRRILPTVVFEYLDELGQGRKDGRKAGKAGRKVRKHGLHMGKRTIMPRQSFLSIVLDSIGTPDPKNPKSKYLKTMRSYLAREKVTHDVIREAASFAQEQNFPLWGRSEIESILGEYGLLNLLYLREHDFVWETLQFID